MERHFRVFSKLGVKRFCVISGYGADKINEEVPKIASKYGTEVTILHNERFDLENGFSVYRAKEWVEQYSLRDFFLTMGDHIFDPNFVKRYMELTSDQDTTLNLAVDIPGESNAHVDIDDVTKVLVDDEGFIQSIGKEIKTYTHYDTGLFRLKAEVFDEFSKSFENERFTISDTVNSLVKMKQAKVSVVDGFTWNDVDNPADLEATKKLLERRSF
ncbi:MAG: hypothetical protein Tsb0034_10650 [Ekhidna sp.]